MKEWMLKLQEKVNYVWGYRNQLSEGEISIVSRIKTDLDSGKEPPWPLHKQFTAIHTAVVAYLGGKG